MSEIEQQAAPGGAHSGASRIERAFAKLGVAALGLVLVALLLAADVALTRLRRVPPGDPLHGALALRVVTRGGQPVGMHAQGGIQYMLSPVSFYEHRPNQPQHEINSLGLRGRPVTREPAQSRIIVVGGSAAFGVGVPASASFVGLLDRERKDREVLNAAVAGYTSMQELALATHRLVGLAPDGMVSFSGWNDLYDAWWRMLVPRTAVRASAQWYDALETSNFEDLESRLARYRLLQERPAMAFLEWLGALVRRSTLLSALSRAVASPPELPPPPPLGPEWVGRVAEAYAANLTTLRDLLAGRGARLLVVLQPALSQVAARPSVESMRQFWGGRD